MKSFSPQYRWNPPKFTDAELKVAEKGRAEMIRKAAEGWDTDGEWQRAMGVPPTANLGIIDNS